MKQNYSFARRALLVITTSALLGLAFIAEATQGEVKGQTLSSSAFPVGTITVDPKFRYVGSSEFVLYGVADSEIHVFAEIENKVVQRFYWVQFEGYLPEKQHNTYNYASDPQRTMIDGHAFHERSWTTNIDVGRKKMRPGSDSAAVLKLLEDKGYVVGPDVMQMRLVRLDEAKRKELMIIYSENLSLHALTAADLAEGGKAVAQRDALIDGLRVRAVAGLKVEMK